MDNPALIPPVAGVPSHPPTVPQRSWQPWRSGRLLVAPRQATLGDRCVKCNAPDDGTRPMKRTLFWHHPAIFLTILIGLLVYIILAMILRKKAVVTFGLCQAHRRRHATHVAITLAMLLLSIASFVFAAMQQSGPLVALGVVLLFAMLIYAVITTRVIWPKKIDDHWVWIKGCGPAYLDTYPERPS